MPTLTPVVVQSAFGQGSAGVCSAIFADPVGAHHTVLIIIGVDKAGDPTGSGDVYSPGWSSPGYEDLTHDLTENRVAQAWDVTTNPAWLAANGIPNGSHTIPWGPNITAWTAEDGLGFGASVYIAGLTEIDVDASDYDAMGHGALDVKVWIFEIANLAPISGDIGTGVFLGAPGVAGTTCGLAAIPTSDLYNAPPALLLEAVLDGSSTASDFSSSAGDPLTGVINGGLTTSLGAFCNVIGGSPSTYGGDTITDTTASSNLLMVSMALDPAFVSGPPDPPPLRYKKIPQTHNFASLTWDQANRLAQYELLRSLGLDSSGLGSLSAWCVALFPDISGQPYQPPTGCTLAVWSEAVDASWNILKNALLASGDGPGPVCGRRVTISPLLSVEYAGEWEVMAVGYQPFAPDVQTDFGGDGAGGVTGFADTPRSPASGSGVITLTLRTYDERVLSLDTSQTASYLTLPGPILGDEFE